MLAPLWGQACGRDRPPLNGSSPPQPRATTGHHGTQPLPPRSPPGPPPPRTLFRSPTNNGHSRCRRAPPKTPFSPPREKFALEFPTFRFFKTWDLRWTDAPKHPGITLPIPTTNRAHFPRFATSTPSFSVFPFPFSFPESGRKRKPPLPATHLQQPRNKPASGEQFARPPISPRRVRIGNA
jgi:hypothetical protein